MQRSNDNFIYSATDLNNFLECRRLTELETLVTLGQLQRPAIDDEQGNLIREKGHSHESAYLKRLQTEYADGVVCFGRAGAGADAYREAEQRTIDAMLSGAKFIYQATFFDGTFIGHADFLRRVEAPSALGAWSYEVLDTKLALSSKPYFVIQLCNYSEHLERIQKILPAYGFIVLGDNDEERFRIADYMAYYRQLKARFLAFMAGTERDRFEEREYPLSCNHCTFCAWNESCEQKREADDHLSLVAGMRNDQIRKLESAGITRVVHLAHASSDARPSRMEPASFAKLQKQANLQVRGREHGRIHELLPHDPRMGFGLLPAPSEGDAYFDMEGDPLYEPGRGLEYLFGCWLPDDQNKFKAFWGLDRAAEKTAFEGFVDFILLRRKQYPAMHVYHYANYEKAALRRLSQVHGTRGEEVDDLLRGDVLVDLYAVVRQSLMISEDSYSIKRLELFYGMKRTTEVKKGDDSIMMFESWLQRREQHILDDIEDYNRDDCRSTRLLHEWLLARRQEAIAKFGHDYPFRPVKSPSAPCHIEYFDGCVKCKKRRSLERDDAKRSALERQLLQGIFEPQSESEYHRMAETWRIRYLMGHMLSYHRREEKSIWWAYYDRCENIDRLQERDQDAIGGLELQVQVAPFKASTKDRNFVYTYRYPEQRHKLDRGEVHDPQTKKAAGQIVHIDYDSRELKLKRAGDLDSAKTVTALIPGGAIKTDAQREALRSIAQHFVDGTLEEKHRATFDLLAARKPRTIPSLEIVQPKEVSASAVSAIVRSLDNSYLFIQGPPGSGKSTVGSQVIADLLSSGKRVGVVSTGHRAIHHLLHMVEAEMKTHGGSFRGLYKHSSSNDESRFQSKLETPFITSTDDNDSFTGDDYDLAGGTSWLFAREALAGTFDYLFIDEAGQVALADAIAVSACAKNVVLLGDPSQLAQVSQGTHSPHVADSVLIHLLGEDKTVSPERGIFLDHSYRMHPEICRFISETIYDGRLEAAPATALHRVVALGVSGAGLRFVPVEHIGNGPSSTEEVEYIVREIGLLRDGTMFDSDGKERGITDADIIVVTPYNAQRLLISAALRKAGFAIEVGTVDKFQGQQAAVVFYSMATSSAEDAPRDLDFLFEQNRFNVAISRARAMSVLVCSPALLTVPCRTPEQMKLANLLCSYVERAILTPA